MPARKLDVHQSLCDPRSAFLSGISGFQIPNVLGWLTGSPSNLPPNHDSENHEPPFTFWNDVANWVSNQVNNYASDYETAYQNTTGQQLVDFIAFAGNVLQGIEAGAEGVNHHIAHNITPPDENGSFDSIPGETKENPRDLVLRDGLQQLYAKSFGSAALLDLNPSGSFVKGGPAGDTGLTGRKIVVDAYGPSVPVGGGAFSGKDPSKVDRSAAYAARHLAKNIVAHKLADDCLVRVSYAIGKADPYELTIDTFDTLKVEQSKLDDFVDKFDMKPGAIIERLDLTNVDYRKDTLFSHFGHADRNWENIESI